MATEDRYCLQFGYNMRTFGYFNDFAANFKFFS